jgi:hypothetical protein
MIAIPELAMNPLSNRIVSVFDMDNRNAINFKQFVGALSVFAKEAKSEQKLACELSTVVSNLYDILYCGCGGCGADSLCFISERPTNRASPFYPPLTILFVGIYVLSSRLQGLRCQLGRSH